MEHESVFTEQSSSHGELMWHLARMDLASACILSASFLALARIDLAEAPI